MSEVVCMTDVGFRPCVQRTSDSRSVLNSPAIPVGTALAGGPPDRSRRAELAHRAPALGPGGEAHAGVGMHDAGRG